MIFLDDFSLQTRLIFTSLFFLSALTQLALCMYKYVSSESFVYCVKDYILMLLSIVFVSVITVISEHPSEYLLRIPAFLIPLLAAALFAHAAANITKEYRLRNKRLSTASVKQAFDNLDSGICFSDPRGKIVLINRVMRQIIYSLIDRYPQSSGDIDNALSTSKKIKMLDYDHGSAIYLFPDGIIRRFAAIPLKGDTEGFTQTVAQDITEIYEINLKLKTENEKLSKTNEKMQKMYDRLADRIREQETLNLKMRIHNDIGSSLIEIYKIINGETNENTEDQIHILQNAVRYFSENTSIASDSFEELKEKARKMSVGLVLEGYIPQNERIEELICAACSECVTNCVKHAHGNNVFVHISEYAGLYTVTITNNGVPPNGPITEGGGLSALRKRTESAGGEMHISSSPAFALILNIPEGEIIL